MIRFSIHLLAAVKWLAVLIPMAVVIGSASAFFLWSLDALTRVRFANPWLLWLLPLAGLAIGWIYHHYGKSASGGNNLLIDEIHQPGAGVPRRMAPLILLGTLVTHLFGGSAGREGTALQMGGGTAATFARILKLDAASVRLLLMAGVAAGFGSVFGTPIAGAVFALEVLVIGRMQYDALIPCFIASLVADWTCGAWGAGHTHYHVAVAGVGARPDLVLFGKVVLAAIAFGLAGGLFSLCSHKLAAMFQRFIPRAELRPVAGGLLVIGLFFLSGTPDYLGLGVIGNRPDAITLSAMFTSTEIPAGAWIWKLVFTVVTLSAGFKGGEVTPLFFIGAALGNSLAIVMGAPVDLFAALGFVAIFAGATNTPLASTLLGMELFGAGNGLYLATACIVAYRFSGHSGIYAAQRLAVPKFRALHHDK
ncbi:MAG: voltage-gated chloride channel family protein [Luteolibacter sp.]|jgi:H+/Cl- antiporter ClcA|nr:voltage-gated chloride channel family protein [Luteolibacter sp.]